MIRKAYKYRIYPNTEQKVFFAKCFGCVRFFYNKSLDDMNERYIKVQVSLKTLLLPLIRKIIRS